MKQRPDGRWAKYVTINGKRKVFYSTEPTEKRAERDIRQQLLNHTETREKGAFFSAIADQWNTEYRQTIPETTYVKSISAAYNRIVQHFGDMRIREIPPAEISLFLHTLYYGQKTVATHKSILNMIFSWAFINGYVDTNPLPSIKLPRGLPKQPRKLPTTDELRIVSQHNEGFALLPFFLLYSGCRKSEALAIRFEDIDRENRIIKVRNHVIHLGNEPIFESVLKTDAARRDVILTERLADAIPKRFTGFLFSMDGDGKEPLTKHAFQRRWDKYCRDHGIKITAHQLRHGYATMLYEAGIDERNAKELMGHTDITLTRSIYTHIRDERKQETARKLNGFEF